MRGDLELYVLISWDHYTDNTEETFIPKVCFRIDRKSWRNVSSLLIAVRPWTNDCIYVFAKLTRSEMVKKSINHYRTKNYFNDNNNIINLYNITGKIKYEIRPQ